MQSPPVVWSALTKYHRLVGLFLHLLKEAIRLNAEDAYIKALLTLKFQEVGQEAEGEMYIEEAWNKS